MKPAPLALTRPQRAVRLGGAIALSVLLTACSAPAPGPTAEAQLFTAAPGLAATATPSPAPSATPTPTVTTTPTASPTATPTPHPLSIAAMRQQAYPGSDLVIEETLETGANYARYLASYQSEGLKIYGLLTIPFGEAPETGWPVIIFNHGFIPPDQYRPTQRYTAYVDGFARNGYIVFRPDYRGHGDSEGQASGGYGSPAYTIDVLNALASVKRLPEADPNRIGMWGHSMGGHITLRAMVVSREIKAGVIWAGVVASYPDLLSRWRRSTGATPTPSSVRRGWRSSLVELYGAPEENPEFWAAISPNTYVAELSGPIQLHHGTADASVPIEFSESLYQQALAAGQTVEYYVYEGDNHNLSGFFTTAMIRSIAFFDEYVKGDGD
jgi:fermentation-respiration switch protein FrsA (DUF1100 family)